MKKIFLVAITAFVLTACQNPNEKKTGPSDGATAYRTECVFNDETVTFVSDSAYMSSTGTTINAPYNMSEYEINYSMAVPCVVSRYTVKSESSIQDMNND